MAGISERNPDTGEFINAEGPEDYEAASTQLQWMEDVLAASTADYLFVGGHYPIFSICTHGPTTWLQNTVHPLLGKYHVTAYLSGHDHCMEYIQDPTYPQLTHIVSGGSSQHWYHSNNKELLPPEHLKFYMAHDNYGDVESAFVAITLSDKHALVTYYSDDAEVLYTAEPLTPRNLNLPDTVMVIM